MAIPAEVFGTQMAVVRFASFSVYCVCGVALWAPDASALSKRRPLCWSCTLDFIILIITIQTNDTKLSTTWKTMRHPFELVNKLKLPLARTAH